MESIYKVHDKHIKNTLASQKGKVKLHIIVLKFSTNLDRIMYNKCYYNSVVRNIEHHSQVSSWQNAFYYLLKECIS